MNWSIITRITKVPITTTPKGLASYATSPRNDMSEMEEISVQKVGTREDSEKKVYEPYTSRERHCEAII